MATSRRWPLFTDSSQRPPFRFPRVGSGSESACHAGGRRRPPARLGSRVHGSGRFSHGRVFSDAKTRDKNIFVAKTCDKMGPGSRAHGSSAAGGTTRTDQTSPLVTDSTGRAGRRKAPAPGARPALSSVENVGLETDKRRFHKETYFLRTVNNRSPAHARRQDGRSSAGCGPCRHSTASQAPFYSFSSRTRRQDGSSAGCVPPFHSFSILQLPPFHSLASSVSFITRPAARPAVVQAAAPAQAPRRLRGRVRPLRSCDRPAPPKAPEASSPGANGPRPANQ